MRIRRPGESSDTAQYQSPMQKIANVGSRIGTIVQGVLFGGLATLFFCAGIGMTASSIYKAYTWQYTTATVTFGLGSDGLEAEPNTCPDKMTYCYAVGGKQHKGEIPVGDDEAKGRKKLLPFKSGKQFPIYYDPAKPEDSTMSITPDSVSLAFCIFVLPFLAIGFNSLWTGLTGREIVKSERPNSTSDAVPGGIAFWILVGFSVFGAILQAILGSLLPWMAGLVTGVALLIAIPMFTKTAGRALLRRKAAREAAKLAAPGDTDNANYSAPTNPAGSLKKELLTSLAFTVFWCGITSVFACIVIGSIIKHIDAMHRFASTTGVMISSKIGSHSGDDSTTYSADLKYRYIVDSRPYTGTQYAYGMGSTSEFKYISGIVNEHPAGKEVIVYYDPQNPAEAILQMEVPTTSYFLLLFLQPFMLIGLAMICWCCAIPSRHRRYRQFFESAPTMPWNIPAWGVMHQEFRGIVIKSRPNIFTPLAYLLCGYGITCFFGIFVVAFAFGGFGEANPKAVLWAFITAGCVGGLAFLRGMGNLMHVRATVTLDQAARRLSVHTHRRSVEAPLDEIKLWQLREIHYSKGVTVNNSNIKYLLLEAVTNDGQSVPLHAFKFSSTDGKAQAVAFRVANQLAAIAGGKVSTEIDSGNDDPSSDSSPAGKGKKVLRKYNDLT